MYVGLYVPRKNEGPASLQALVLYGAGTRNRTRDLLITSQLPIWLKSLGRAGLMYVKRSLEAFRIAGGAGFCT